MCGRVVCKWVGSRREVEDRSAIQDREGGEVNAYRQSLASKKKAQRAAHFSSCVAASNAHASGICPRLLCVWPKSKGQAQGVFNKQRAEDATSISKWGGIHGRTYLDGRCLLLQPRSCSLACVPVNGGLCGAKVSGLWLRLDMQMTQPTENMLRLRRARHARTQK